MWLAQKTDSSEAFVAVKVAMAADDLTREVAMLFSPLSRSGIPQRSSESSVERMKDGRQNARPRLDFIQLERNQGMYPQFSSSNCVVLKMAYSKVWNRYVFFQCTAPRYALGLFHNENSYK